MEREEMDQSGGSSGIGKRSRSEYECDGDTEHDVASAEDSGAVGEGSGAAGRRDGPRVRIPGKAQRPEGVLRDYSNQKTHE